MAILADQRCTLRAPISFLIYSLPLLTISATAPLAASAALTGSRPPLNCPATPRGSPAQFDRGAQPGNRGIVIGGYRSLRQDPTVGARKTGPDFGAGPSAAALRKVNSLKPRRVGQLLSTNALPPRRAGGNHYYLSPRGDSTTAPGFMLPCDSSIFSLP